MPYMNGLELTKAVREDHPDMEIVIFSGYNDFSYAREALRYGVVDYVLKPVDPEEFHKTFQRVMENISSKIEKKEQQEKKEDYLKKYFLLKYLYEGKRKILFSLRNLQMEWKMICPNLPVWFLSVPQMDSSKRKRNIS